MTADWRATLERVERLATWTLRDRREPDKVLAYAKEMASRLRGLLAEPQPHEHPETICRRCGGPNVSWFAPSPLWNAAMRGGSIDGPQEFGELICPTCFCVLAEERGIAAEWRIAAGAVHVALETTTPSGRVWDHAADLWVSGLAEPQVNPSEAKDLKAIAKSILRRRDQWPEGHVAWRVLEGILNTELAGLLAEGEEGREP